MADLVSDHLGGQIADFSFGRIVSSAFGMVRSSIPRLGRRSLELARSNGHSSFAGCPGNQPSRRAEARGEPLVGWARCVDALVAADRDQRDLLATTLAASVLDRRPHCLRRDRGPSRWLRDPAQMAKRWLHPAAQGLRYPSQTVDPQGVIVFGIGINVSNSFRISLRRSCDAGLMRGVLW